MTNPCPGLYVGSRIPVAVEDFHMSWLEFRDGRRKEVHSGANDLPKPFMGLGFERRGDYIHCMICHEKISLARMIDVQDESRIQAMKMRQLKQHVCDLLQWDTFKNGDLEALDLMAGYHFKISAYNGVAEGHHYVTDRTYVLYRDEECLHVSTFSLVEGEPAWRINRMAIIELLNVAEQNRAP